MGLLDWLPPVYGGTKTLKSDIEWLKESGKGFGKTFWERANLGTFGKDLYVGQVGPSMYVPPGTLSMEWIPEMLGVKLKGKEGKLTLPDISLPDLSKEPSGIPIKIPKVSDLVPDVKLPDIVIPPFPEIPKIEIPTIDLSPFAAGLAAMGAGIGGGLGGIPQMPQMPQMPSLTDDEGEPNLVLIAALAAVGLGGAYLISKR